MADFRVGVGKCRISLGHLIVKKNNQSVFSAMETCHGSQFEGALCDKI